MYHFRRRDRDLGAGQGVETQSVEGDRAAGPHAPAKARRASERGWLGRAFLRFFALLIGSCFALGAIEVFARTLPPSVYDRLRPRALDGTPNTRQQTYQLVEDQRLGYWLKPGSEGRIVYPQPDGGPAREIVYTINADGFRDTPRTRTPPPGTFRIAMLGDSFVYGNGVQQNETLPYALERALNTQAQGATYEVMNCGVFAYNTRQEVELLKARVLQFQPHMVILTFFLNDVFHPQMHEPEEKNEGWETAAISRLGLGLDPSLEGEIPETWLQHCVVFARRNFASAKIGARWLHRRLDAKAYERKIQALYEPDSRGWLQVVGAFDEARRLARHRGFELRVAICPYVEHVDDYPWRVQHNRIQELCKELGIVCHDLLPAIDGRRAADLIVHPLDTHGNAHCNDLMGRYLASELRVSGLGAK